MPVSWQPNPWAYLQTFMVCLRVDVAAACSCGPAFWLQTDLCLLHGWV